MRDDLIGWLTHYLTERKVLLRQDPHIPYRDTWKLAQRPISRLESASPGDSKNSVTAIAAIHSRRSGTMMSQTRQRLAPSAITIQHFELSMRQASAPASFPESLRLSYTLCSRSRSRSSHDF